MSDTNLPALSAASFQVHAQSAWDQSQQSLVTALSQQLTIAFLGSASSGKDSAIRALFGVDFGEISPIPGSTDRLRVVPLDKEEQVLLLNAPGFGDIRQEVDAAARNVLDSLDIIVYIVNCEGGATIDERRDLQTIRAMGRPVLVCLNKIDLIRPLQRETFIEATLAQLNVPRSMAVVCAFDPLPQLSPDPIGLSEVNAWIAGQLEASGKDLLFAKHLRSKSEACEPLLLRASRNAAIAGAVPIPGADLAAVTAIQIKLIHDIAVVHEISIDKDIAVFIISQVLSGGMRGFVRWGAEALKAAGWLPGGQILEVAILSVSAAVAGGTTYGVGKAAIQYFQSGGRIESEQLRDIFDQAAFAYQKLKVAREAHHAQSGS